MSDDDDTMIKMNATTTIDGDDEAILVPVEDYEAAERVEARLAAKARRKEMRRKAEGYEEMLIQRDALASRGLRLCGKGLDLVEAVEKLFSAMNDGVEGEIRSGLRMKVGDALDDLVELIEFSHTGGDE